MCELNSLVPRFPDLFNVHEKEGEPGTQNHMNNMNMGGKNARLQMQIKSPIPTEKDIDKSIATVSLLARCFSRLFRMKYPVTIF